MTINVYSQTCDTGTPFTRVLLTFPFYFTDTFVYSISLCIRCNIDASHSHLFLSNTRDPDVFNPPPCLRDNKFSSVRVSPLSVCQPSQDASLHFSLSFYLISPPGLTCAFHPYYSSR